MQRGPSRKHRDRAHACSHRLQASSYDIASRVLQSADRRADPAWCLRCMAAAHLTMAGSAEMRSANVCCSQTSLSESAAYAAPNHRSMNVSPFGEL